VDLFRSLDPAEEICYNFCRYLNYFQ